MTYKDRVFEIKIRESFTLDGMSLTKDEIIKIHNYRGTVYWNITKLNGESRQIKRQTLRKEFITAQRALIVNEDTDDSVGEAFFHIMDFAKFAMKPNRDLSKAFLKVLSKEEYKDYNQKILDSRIAGAIAMGIDTKDFSLRHVPIEQQAMYISWPQSRWQTDEEEIENPWGTDLGPFKDVYAVVMKPEMLEAVGWMLEEHTYYLSIVELDDRYRFIIQYDQIIGNRWIFENYKGEDWEL